MYRVLIVDDEKYIRKSIINRIRWEECGAEVAGEAGDGKEACEMIALYQPEIVITDIRMPGMDGLELAEWAAREYPSIRMIIISAYNEFEYARRAIRYGVKEYLLKPVVEEELEETLLRLETELEQARTRPPFPEISAETAEKMEFADGEFFVTAFFLPEVRDEFRQEELAGKIWKKLEEEKKNRALRGEIYFIREGQEEQCSFLWNTSGLTEKETGEILRELKRNGPAKESVWAGVSGQASGRMEEKMLLKLQSEALTALKRKIFLGGGGKKSIFYSQCRKDPEALKRYKNDLLLLYDLSVSEDWERLKIQMEELIESGLKKAASVMELEFLVGELLFILERISRVQGYLYETRVLFHGLKKPDYLLGFGNVEELAAEVKRAAGIALSYPARKRKHDVVEEVRDYVQRHFMEDLSVAQIAGIYHLNAAYLSSIFKERNNISLSAYIEGVRMEKAKKFLREDWGNVTEAALAAGYADANYFTKVFKKYTGMTPSQWKKQG